MIHPELSVGKTKERIQKATHDQQILTNSEALGLYEVALQLAQFNQTFDRLVTTIENRKWTT